VCPRFKSLENINLCLSVSIRVLKIKKLIMKLLLSGVVAALSVFLAHTSVFALQYTFTPRVSIRESYTDNVNLAETNKEDDFIMDATAGGTFSALGRTGGMNLSFDPGYRWYAKGTELDTWRLPVTLDIWSQISRKTRLEFFNRFLRDDDPEGAEAVVSEEDGQVKAPGDTSVRRGRRPYYTNYATARINHEFGRDDSSFGQFLYSLRREEEQGGNENDHYALSGGFIYWFGPRWGTTVNSNYTIAKFENSPNYHDIAGIFQVMRRITGHFQLFGRYGYAYRDNDEDVSDYVVHAPSAGFSYELAKDSRASLVIGYFLQEFKDSDIDPEEGCFFNGDLFKRWDYQRWSASLRGLAGLDRNDFGNERLGFEWSAGIFGDASYKFTSTFSGNVTGSYRYSDIINDVREDSRISVGAGLGWVPTTWMALNLDYTFNRLISTSAKEYEENRILLRLTLQPERSWRF